MSYDALRRGRCSLSGYAYHITVVTVGRRPAFSCLNTARIVIDELRRCDASACTTTLAWVLMPDHLHWLFVLGVDATLAQTLRDFKGRSAYRVNNLENRRGPFWQRAYHDHAVREEEDVKSIARYIIANPLRAGIVDDIGQYPHWDAVWI